MKLEYQTGNHKLGDDTLIINMGPAKTCPAGRCYAMKAERMYKQSLPYRRRQAIYWKRKSAETISKDIKNVLDNRPRIKYIRFNEAGDFYGQECVKKLSAIAGSLAGRVSVFTYTHRKDLDFSNLDQNLTINGSGFMVHNNFTTVKEYTPGAKIRCNGDCRTCKICYARRGVKIEVKQH